MYPTDKPIRSCTVCEDIINSAEYITSAEDMLLKHADIYIESHSPQTSNISTTVASTRPVFTVFHIDKVLYVYLESSLSLVNKY